MLKAQIHLIRAALDDFEAAVQAGDLRHAVKKAGEIEAIGMTMRVEMELAYYTETNSEGFDLGSSIGTWK